MSPTAIRLVTLILAGVAYAASSYLTGSGHDGLIAVAAALLGWTVPMPAQVGRKSLPPIALVFAVLLSACGASVYDATLSSINGTAEAVNIAQAAVLTLCDADPGQRCDDARKAYETAGAAVAAAHDALEVYRVTGEGLDEVGRALKVATDSAREVARVSAN